MLEPWPGRAAIKNSLPVGFAREFCRRKYPQPDFRLVFNLWSLVVYGCLSQVVEYQVCSFKVVSTKINSRKNRPASALNLYGWNTTGTVGEIDRNLLDTRKLTCMLTVWITRRKRSCVSSAAVTTAGFDKISLKLKTSLKTFLLYYRSEDRPSLRHCYKTRHKLA